MIPLTREHARRLWLLWVGVGVLGWLVGSVASLAQSALLSRVVGGLSAVSIGLVFSAVSLVLSLGVATLVATLQWLLLRPYLQRAESWIMASAVGALVGGVLERLLLPVVFSLTEASVRSYLPITQLLAAVTTVAPATAQWLVLQSRVERAWRWPVAVVGCNVVGSALLSGALLAMQSAEQLPSGLSPLLSAGAYGLLVLVASIITGRVMLGLLRRPIVLFPAAGPPPFIRGGG